MKYIKDQDLGIDCDHVARGENDSEVLNNETSHLKQNHPEDYERVKGMMSSMIREEDEDDEEMMEMQ